MDIERIQKINDLALGLMRQGLAQTRDEAIEQAEKIFRQKDDDNLKFSEIRVGNNGLPKTNIEEKNIPNYGSSEQKKEQAPLSEDKIKDILSRNSEFLVKVIRDFKERMTDMEKTIDELKTMIRNQPRANEFTKNDISVNQIKEAPATNINETPKDDAPKPRYGDYKAEDVSIEKYFYMGHK